MSSFADFSNAAATRTPTAQVSVLIPFYKDDPVPLMACLAEQVSYNDWPVEIVLFDDGEPDSELNQRVEDTVACLSTPVRLLTAHKNVGRAAGRNRLSAAAIGQWHLFLDADMTVRDDFIGNWLYLIDTFHFDAAFGGYTADPVTDRAHDLHAALARTSDENTADCRNDLGATAFCTSNLIVKAELMRKVRFDEHFTGWGWEDVDWAVRADHVGKLVHFDNPAGHSGWQSAGVLLGKFRDAAHNYARLLDKHPELATLPSAKAARILKSVPGQALLRGVWSVMARSNLAPMKARTTALKLWRASWAAEVI